MDLNSVICGFKFRKIWIKIPWFVDYERKQQIQDHPTNIVDYCIDSV